MSSRSEKKECESKNEFKSLESSEKDKTIQNGYVSHQVENELESGVKVLSKIENSEKGGSKRSEMPVKKDHGAASSENGQLPHGQGPGTSSVGAPSQIEPSHKNEITEEDSHIITQVG